MRPYIAHRQGNSSGTVFFEANCKIANVISTRRVSPTEFLAQHEFDELGISSRHSWLFVTAHGGARRAIHRFQALFGFVSSHRLPLLSANAIPAAFESPK